MLVSATWNIVKDHSAPTVEKLTYYEVSQRYLGPAECHGDGTVADMEHGQEEDKDVQLVQRVYGDKRYLPLQFISTKFQAQSVPL
jgi:hypothetical protein